MNSANMEEEVPLLHLMPIIQRLIKLSDAHKQYGLTKSQVIVMIALRYRENVTMSEIAQYISSSKEQATRAVAVLFDHGLVERFEQPQNRTHVYIRFSEQGRAFMHELESQFHKEISHKLSSSLTPEEIETLRNSLQTSIDLLSKVK